MSDLEVVPPGEPTLIGQIVGNYKVVAELGKGGMGVVYVAEHTLIGKKAAIKVLLPRFTANPDIVQRFFNEAKAAAMIAHEGIVEVFDFGKLPDGSAYLAMELLEGESLTRRLKRDGVVALPELVAIAQQVASALGAAHAKSIVHRDLKPDNVFLVPDPHLPFGVRVKVLDFGVAKLADEGEPDEVKTKAGELLGTPYYMSPEQCRGAGEVDHRSDVYALGCIVYQMATGTVPFDEKGTGALIAAHIYEAPPPPRSIDSNLAPALEQVILRTLEKDPAARPQSMAALADELAAVLKAPGAGGQGASVVGSHSKAGGRDTTTRAARPSAGPLAAGTPPPDASRPTFAGPAGPAAAPTPTVAAPSTATVAKAGRSRIGMIAAALAAVGLVGWLVLRGGGEKAAVVPSVTAAAPVVVIVPDAAPPAPTSCDSGDLPDCVVQAARAAAGDGVPVDPVRAATLYKRACDGGIVEACVAYGFAVERGSGVERDETRAFATYLAACDAKDAEGCARLGRLYMDGRGVALDSARALAAFKRACDAGEGRGCRGLGWLAMFGQGTTFDPAAARAQLARACELGDALGCAHAAGLAAADDAEAGRTLARRGRELAAAGCARNDAEACLALGLVRLGGLGGDVDSQGARDLARACELGLLDACAARCLAGERHANAADVVAACRPPCDAGADEACAVLGRTLVRDGRPEQAADELERACARGGDTGCGDLGDLYAQGLGVAKDEPHAGQLYRKGCEGGDALACQRAAERLAGAGPRRDERKARAAAQKACAIDTFRCATLARFAAAGVGGPADLELARSSYARACAAGDPGACAFKDDPLAALAPDAGPATTDTDAGATTLPLAAPVAPPASDAAP